MRLSKSRRPNRWSSVAALAGIAAFFRRDYLILATFLPFKLFLVFVCITLIYFPQARATSPSSFQSRPESEDDVELFVSLRHLQSYHISSPHRSASSFNSFATEKTPQLQMDEPDEPMFGDDDLIYSGSGCFDDEDKCTGFTEVSSDDLITPVYIPPKDKTTEKALPPSPEEDDKDDDDDDDDGDEECTEDEEDCIEGSGSQEQSSSPSPFASSSTHTSIIIPPHVITSTHVPTYHYYQPTPFTAPPAYHWPRPTEAQYPSEITNKYENKFINEVTVPPWTELPKPRSPRPVSPRPPPPRPTHIRIIDVPKPPERNIVEREKPKKPVPKQVSRSDTSPDNMAMFIGLAAMLLILIVIATPSILFLKRKYQPVDNYKCDDRSKGLRFLPVSQTPAALLSGSHHGQLNSAITEAGDKTVKSCKKKDLKEWYV